MIQLKDHMKLNKTGGPSVDSSISLRMGNKTIVSATGRERPGCLRRAGERKCSTGSGMCGDRKEPQRASKMNRNMQQFGIGGRGGVIEQEPLETPRHLGCERLLEPSGDNFS